LQQTIGYITRTITKTEYDSKDRVTVRKTLTSDQWATDIYAETSYVYDHNGDVTLEKTIEFSPEGPLKTSLGYQGSYISVRGAYFGDQYQSSYREVKYERNKTEGITKTITLSLVPFISAIDGQETMSRYRDAGNQLDQSRLSTLLGIAKQLVSAGSEVRISTAREHGLQKRPSEAERTAAANQKAPSVETVSAMTWAVGSATSQTAIELSPPYVPDDRIVYSGGTNGTYSVIKGEADQKALHYARTENRLLLGHRNGNGIQVLPELLPAEPMGQVFIRLNGCTGAFRINGTTYNIDPQGVTATADALFWGAVDGTVADTWFPLPPGATSLPSPVSITTNASPAPANSIAIPQGFNASSPDLAALFAALPVNQAPVFAQTAAPAAILRPYRETVEIAAGSGSGAMATALPWIRQPAMEVLAGSGSGVVATKMKRLIAGTGSGAIATLSAASGGGGGGSGGTGALLAFTGGTSMAWGSKVAYGFTFTLSASKTIKGVGFYDENQNGLTGSYSIMLLENSTNTMMTTPFDDDWSQYVMTVPSGTAATLSGSWRRVDLTATGRLLDADVSYTLYCEPVNAANVDNLIKGVSGVTTLTDASFGQNYSWINSGGNYIASTTSADGAAYFGPMIFFE